MRDIVYILLGGAIHAFTVAVFIYCRPNMITTLQQQIAGMMYAILALVCLALSSR